MSFQPAEHVVLADCKDDNKVLQSQMAYFNTSSPETIPQDTAVVPTPDGQLATWFCDFSSGQFTTTGVKFNATLGPKRSEGDYIGDGTNGYDSTNGGFKCWQEHKLKLYKQGQFFCSQVLVCDHRVAPSPLPQTSCAVDTDTDTDRPGGLSQGDIIGIGVGVGCGITGLIALAAIVLVWRRRQRRRLETGGGEEEESVTPIAAGANYYCQHPQELETRQRVEADGSSPLGELDNNPINRHHHEMETPESRYYAHYDERGNTLPRT